MRHLTRIKVCGMRSAEDIELAVRCGVDAVGFITDVPVKTPRKINLEKARELISLVPLFVDSVLVIMPDSAQEAIEMIEATRPDIVQIHNSLELDDMRKLRANTDVGIVSTFHIHVNGDVSVDDLIDEINVLASEYLIDGVLLDTAIVGKAGGTGQLHDPSISRKVVERVNIPVILAGGLNPENVEDRVSKVLPFAVDTASGVETGGMKDGDKIASFVNAVRCAK